MSRREFLGTTAQVGSALPAVCGALLPSLAQAHGHAGANDLLFGSASVAIRALRAGHISAVELTGLMYARIDAINPRINAVVVQMREEALEGARQADQERAKGRNAGSLHGVPVTIKDAFEIKGVRTTAGNPEFKNHIATRDSAVVERLRRAGAILLGTTNVPLMLSDWQSYNDIYGQTNNPWDLSRTPGGSTGGGAAALAAGIGYLAAGSDVCGSIRVPAHYCGVYGHKPTFHLVPGRGHIPPISGIVNPPDHLGVYGVLARHPEDLPLALNVLGGPDGDDATAYRWTLPPARRTRLRDYRLGYVLSHKRCAVTADEHIVLANAIAALRKAGAELAEGWPPGVDPEQDFQNYVFLLNASGDDGPQGALLQDFVVARRYQLAARATWQDYFRTHDAFLMPTEFLTAFPHDHSEPMSDRILHTSEGPRPYDDLMFWPSFASHSGHPATVAPVGLTTSGLPVGLQIVGPYLEDATPMDIAAKIEELLGGFRVPTGIPA